MNDEVWRPEPEVTYRIWHSPPWGWVARMHLQHWRGVTVAVAWLGWSKSREEAMDKCRTDWAARDSSSKESSDAEAVQ